MLQIWNFQFNCKIEFSRNFKLVFTNRHRCMFIIIMKAYFEENCENLKYFPCYSQLQEMTFYSTLKMKWLLWSIYKWITFDQYRISNVPLWWLKNDQNFLQNTPVKSLNLCLLCACSFWDTLYFYVLGYNFTLERRGKR